MLQQIGFFAAQASALQTGQNYGLQLFAPLRALLSLLLQNLLCPSITQSLHRSALFHPKIICWGKRYIINCRSKIFGSLR
jgi:hypothetical protein